MPAALCPFRITVETIAGFLNCELPDDPPYDGVELQRFDDPEHGPGLLIWLVTRAVPVFRRWPTTYRWTATLTLGDEPRMTSRWRRTGNGDDSYRAATQGRRP